MNLLDPITIKDGRELIYQQYIHEPNLLIIKIKNFRESIQNIRNCIEVNNNRGDLEYDFTKHSFKTSMIYEEITVNNWSSIYRDHIIHVDIPNFAKGFTDESKVTAYLRSKIENIEKLSYRQDDRIEKLFKKVYNKKFLSEDEKQTNKEQKEIRQLEEKKRIELENSPKYKIEQYRKQLNELESKKSKIVPGSTKLELGMTVENFQLGLTAHSPRAKKMLQLLTELVKKDESKQLTIQDFLDFPAIIETPDNQSHSFQDCLNAIQGSNECLQTLIKYFNETLSLLITITKRKEEINLKIQELEKSLPKKPTAPVNKTPIEDQTLKTKNSLFSRMSSFASAFFKKHSYTFLLIGCIGGIGGSAALLYHHKVRLAIVVGAIGIACLIKLTLYQV